MGKIIRIGGGAGYSGDRIEPAVELALLGKLDYLIFECLAERTIAIAQQARLSNPAAGYDPLLEQRMHAVLGACVKNGVTIVTNMGAANPQAAADKIREIALGMGIRGLKVAAVCGDDVLAEVRAGNFTLEEEGNGHSSSGSTAGTVEQLGARLISANAYLGVQGLLDALAMGADVVITGRVADPALVLAPLIHEFGWAMDDWTRLGQGTVVGHLLECAGQITGGYFADPGYKDVPDLARLGFPIAEVDADGVAVITKLAGSGGRVSVASCKEQLLYEIHDPRSYLTPDVIADFSEVSVIELDRDRVLVAGGRGRARPETLKVSLGYQDSFVGEGQMSYAGPGARERARLALDIVAERLALCGVQFSEARYEMIGVDAIRPRSGGTRPVHGEHSQHDEPAEVRVRVVARTDSLAEAQRIGNEVETLYTNGPAGGGGATRSAREVVAVRSLLLPRELARARVVMEVS